MIFLIGCCLVFSSCKETGKDRVEKSVSAAKHGMWYPAEPDGLKKSIQDYFDKVAPLPHGNVIGMIVPHAGYIYSGETAARAFRSLQPGIKRVIVIGAAHFTRLGDVAVVPAADIYSTPLGKIPIEKNMIKALLDVKVVKSDDTVFANEHSVDNEIPFLQSALKDFKIIPIMVGQLSLKNALLLADAIRPFLDKDSLVVASSDFTHYGPNFDYVPFKDNVAFNLAKLDSKAADLIMAHDLKGFLEFEAKTRDTICGVIPISILMSLLPANAHGVLVHYDTSGRQTKDYTNSVSYQSIIFTGSWSMEIVLGNEEKSELLKLSRKVLETYIRTGKKLSFSETGAKMSEVFKNKAGAFVTLEKKGELRGCIGEILPQKEIFQVVIDKTIDSAVNDPRFSAVKAGELGDIEIEISILTPPKSVASWKEIVIGKHGMLLHKNGRGAVFLPQVAPEQGWDLATTLTHLAMKAGLAPDAWKEGADFEVFEALVFNEMQMKK
jgi:AmmeMemoRadiSam system protein B/AmmeMemoRadiSam system protein A